LSGGPTPPGRRDLVGGSDGQSTAARTAHRGVDRRPVRRRARGRKQGSGRQQKDTRTVSSYKVGVIGGDGIGPEVVAEAIKVVETVGVSLDTTEYDLVADRYVRTGEVLPDAVLAELRAQDAILLGAVGPPVGSTDVPSGTLERGLLLRL